MTGAQTWRDARVLQLIRDLFITGRGLDDNWQYEVSTLQKYDKHHLFTNAFLDQLFAV